MRNLTTKLVALAIVGLLTSITNAQSVCLPAPRLLTTMPMGGQVGTTVDIKITCENCEDNEELSFSHPGLTATHKLDDNGQPLPDQYVVSIARDCPPGIYDAHVMTRLGISSARAFNVGTLSEVVRTKPNTTLETAMSLDVNSICNASMTSRMVDFYTFNAAKDQRIVVDCAAQGIDSKLKPVLFVADSTGADLQVERRGGAVDFVAPADGTYVVKVHDLTFNGGAEYFYRLAVQAASAEEAVPRLVATRNVSSFSWPPTNLTDDAIVAEVEPNDQSNQAMQINLPCDISGSFYPAADVDTFEFTASKGDVWWVEVASERLGRPTDASIIVQHIDGEGDDEKVTDVAELTDIAHPIKVSSNGYAYDGPPYHAGSPDILGKLEIKTDGRHRLQLLDLFGGTRSDPHNTYRLIVRKAEPDFAVVGWALHMELRNGDRNALSKPLALRNGYTMPIEVVAIRRDGFDGDIHLHLDNLPDGVTATGLKIPAGKTRGLLMVTADENAPRGVTLANFSASAIINEKEVVRTGHMASMKWPVPNAKSEIPAPRLMADIPVSVGGSEGTPITIAAAEDKVWEVTVGEKLTIPLQKTLRCPFSGPKMSLRTYGDGFEAAKAFDIPLTSESSEAVLDLAALKTQPGDYTIAFYGSAVAKYAYNPAAVSAAEVALETAKAEAAAAATEVATLTETEAAATEQEQTKAKAATEAALARQKAADSAAKTAEARLKAAVSRSNPKDIVDIVVSKPIQIRVNPAPEAKK
ncbi:MAG: PPC domain-containing protein [Planctomycetaceae bacterium]